MYIKAGFEEKEPDSNGQFRRHEVWGRYYDTTVNKVVQARAVMIAGVGLSVELTRCDATNGKDTVCSGTPEVNHYNASGDLADNREVMFGTRDGGIFFRDEGAFFNPAFVLTDAGVN